MYQALRFVMNAGFKAAGYNGVRSTPSVHVRYINLYMHSQTIVCCAGRKEEALTKHDWDVCQKEDQVDQIMLAFPDR